jgi:hypothetical protein
LVGAIVGFDFLIFVGSRGGGEGIRCRFVTGESGDGSGVLGNALRDLFGFDFDAPAGLPGQRFLIDLQNSGDGGDDVGFGQRLAHHLLRHGLQFVDGANDAELVAFFVVKHDEVIGLGEGQGATKRGERGAPAVFDEHEVFIVLFDPDFVGR